MMGTLGAMSLPRGRHSPHWAHDLVSEASEALSVSLGTICTICTTTGTGCPVGPLEEVVAQVGSLVTCVIHRLKETSIQ